LRLISAHAIEIVPMDDHGFRPLESGDGGGPAGVRRQEGELAEHLALALDGEGDLVAVARGQANRHPPALDHVERIGRVALMKDDLAWSIAVTARSREQTAALVLGQPFEQAPHERIESMRSRRSVTKTTQRMSRR